MLFSQIIGQHEIKQHLIQTVKENRVSHAQLFYGPPSTGKLALAIAYAQYLSCTGEKDNDSCGVCASCHKYQRLIHPDLHFVFPVVSVTGKANISDNFIDVWRKTLIENQYISLNYWLDAIGAENKQGNIYTDEAHQIIRKLSLKTFESEYKIMIIWLPERMHNTTANKLLKILEEPPAKTLFLLITDNQEDIISTILSRTQPLKIPRIDYKSLANALIEQYNISESEAVEISRMSQGNYLQAQSHINTSEDLNFFFEKFKELMRLAYQRNVAQLINWVNDLAKLSREKQKSFMEYSLKMIRGSFMIRHNFEDFSLLLKNEIDFSQNFSAFITENNIEALSDEFDRAAYHIERNANGRIVLHDLGFKIMMLIRQ
ncbi:MAG: DNA polymerase III subunit delta [Bacteroidales bacterium]|nr:DNA polymerase III subunit delta [Bacteroidales bacterium]